MIPDKHEPFFMFIRKNEKNTRSVENIFLRVENRAGISYTISSEKAYSAVAYIAFDISRRTAEQRGLKIGFSLQCHNEIVIIFSNITSLERDRISGMNNFPFVGLVKVANPDPVGVVSVIKVIAGD